MFRYYKGIPDGMGRKKRYWKQKSGLKKYWQEKCEAIGVKEKPLHLGGGLYLKRINYFIADNSASNVAESK
jgi:hypothetical protein